ncbi:unnamed protein product [Lepeophtheirus salmonis]|uniref:(salmon louse) hypothetical protein n=1 Tax=Lepeophtheirus salmonis TaxID=72036 RepID=A0A0K2UEX0_LEPSM|nr:uncharacterized protein LOC121127553 [Lepeophtheirus salmonis]XP_040582513.1 uncharacterized protein LOC121130962 [Lepeophtheirus salmonis]CAB4054706.1 unnamed protein product [Lepeophtheirus salmonis]CAF2761519.1 unnamed protein product [Lepeophtheirus salmonis]
MDMSNNRLYLRNYSIYQNDRILFNDTTTLEDISSANRPIFIGSFNQPFLNSLVPFLVTFYLFVIFTCLNTIYRYIVTDQDNHSNSNTPVIRNRGMNNNTTVGNVTPPPSYSIFIDSGESILIPPPYKMVLPYIYSSNGNPSSISPSNSITSINEANDVPPSYCITCHTIQTEPLTIFPPPSIIEEESDKSDLNEEEESQYT